MRILQVLTLISADGAYGGPVAVARQQAEALAALGHEVTVLAGWDGRAGADWSGVDVRLFKVRQVVPGAGFSGLGSTLMLRQLRSLLSSTDIVHVHLSRDLVSLPAAILATRSCPTVVQTHGMIRVDRRPRARLLDRLLTRPALRRVSLQLVLTDEEQADAPLVAGRAIAVKRIRNGVAAGSDVATWRDGVTPEVIYCARLHRRKRPEVFVEMADILLQRGLDARFVMFGPDEGELAEVEASIQQRGVSDRVSYCGPLAPDDVLPRLARSQVYVLPSIDEPFPMSLLEAMSLGLPSVITESTGVSAELHATEAAQVTHPSAASLASGVMATLQSRQHWERLSERAAETIRTSFGAAGVAALLEQTYLELTSTERPTGSGGR